MTVSHQASSPQVKSHTQGREGGRRSQRPRQPDVFSLPRLLPWPTFLSRAWAGTPLVCWAVLTTALLVWPTWPTVGILSGVLGVLTLCMRVPLGAAPRLQFWFICAMLGGCIGAALGGGFLLFLRAICVALLVLWGTSLILWSVAPDRIPGAIHVLLSPLARLKLPVDEWVHVMSLAVRGLPLVGEQMRAATHTILLRYNPMMRRAHTAYLEARTQAKAAGVRPPTVPTPSLADYGRVLTDITTAVLSASSRTAADTGRAISLRGGLPALTREPVRLSWRDALLYAGTALACAAIVWLH